MTIGYKAVMEFSGRQIDGTVIQIDRETGKAILKDEDGNLYEWLTETGRVRVIKNATQKETK